MSPLTKKMLIRLASFAFLAVIGFSLMPHGTFAQTSSGTIDLGLNYGAQTGLASTDVRIIIARIVRAALGFLGVLAVILVLYGGFTYMTAGGSEEKIAQAKKILVNAGIGLIIILSAYAIVSFVMRQLVGATTGSDSSQSGGAVGDDSGGGGSFSSAFYVNTLPQTGQVCVRNINLVIAFNKEVDLRTVTSTGAIIVEDKSNSQPVAGDWSYGTTKNVIIFTPAGSCSPSTGNDCLKASSDYTLIFRNAGAIRTLNKNPELSLKCQLKAGCGPVAFTSGDGVDRLPPTVNIAFPTASDALEAGSTVPVRVTYTDDNGLQNVALYAGDGSDKQYVDGVSFSGCKKTDTLTINWPTKTSYSGERTLVAVGTDWAGFTGIDNQIVNFRPSHCYNGILETNLGEQQLGASGPPECGGQCGTCDGGTCSNNIECSGGQCINGVCRSVMKIISFSPRSGSPGTYVSIQGQQFGTQAGKVYFSNKSAPDVANENDWIEAKIIQCGTTFNAWTSVQIIAQVPTGASAATHIKVVTAPDAQGRTSVDATTRHSGLAAFEVNNVIRPNICNIDPGSAKSGETVSVLGQGFGLITTANDRVVFGSLTANVARDTNNQAIWSDGRVAVAVPSIDYGNVGVKVVKNNVESNSIRFYVEPGASDGSPFIESVTPDVGAVGEYITIVGRNFGDKLGSVWFRKSSSDPAVTGDTNFPAECKGVTWTDNKIIIKAPAGLTAVGEKYLVQVIRPGTTNPSALNQNITFTLQAGAPAPGICKISPSSGPIPFPSGQQVKLSGEYFTTPSSNASQIYFWKAGATSPKLTEGRPLVESKYVIALSSNSATVYPPTDAATGPVSVYRTSDSKISNPAQFQAFDCRDQANKCAAGSRCCLNGAQAGLCKPTNEQCSGEVLTAGYVWRFSTRDIPPVPKVLERCDQTVALGQALPSPSPSTLWSKSTSGVSEQVCRTAAVSVEFTTRLDQATVNASTVKVYRCTNIDQNNCVNPTEVSLRAGSYTLRTAAGTARGDHDSLEIYPNEKWNESNWYQVVLNKNIKTLSGGTRALALSADRPCGGNSAYCFVFKTGENDCRLGKIIVTPYTYLTRLLEAPISRPAFGGGREAVEFRGNALSDQACIMMDPAGIAWNWSGTYPAYADIYSERTGRGVTVSALANTVGVNLNPENAAKINAQGTVGSVQSEGTSLVTVDLSTPEVVSYWPNCSEACTNAEVGVQFNVTMSEHNLLNAASTKSVQLLKCNDGNCFSTEPVDNTLDIVLAEGTNGTVVRLANSKQGSKELEPNTLYQVIVSATSTDPKSDDRILWSREKLKEASSYSKPYNKQFTWRFRTKTQRCEISRAEVLPKEFIARLVDDRSVYTVQPYSSPDACSATGQKLNPWKVSWNWNSSNENVARKVTFSTVGFNSACTSKCILKGSTIPARAGAVATPVCGNNKVEAGEDCDAPDKDLGCGLDCRWLGKSNGSTCGNGILESGEACDPKFTTSSVGCSIDCRRLGSKTTADATDVNASICGNGLVDSGEDCDIAISQSSTNNQSAALCNEKCLHRGTRISSKWCELHQQDAGHFSGGEYLAACSKAYSQCGDGITGPDEDQTCETTGDGKHAAWCNDYCLITAKSTNECVPNEIGCGANGQHLGSSLLYPNPSICGNGKVETGEDASCEDAAKMVITRTDNGIDPWVLAIAVGRGDVSGNPPVQRSNISAGTVINSRTVSGSGEFLMTCGFRTDTECAERMGSSNYGVGDDSCCYLRPQLVGTTPNNGAAGVCRNTEIQARFSAPISPAALNDNFIIARGVTSTSDNCATSTQDVTSLIAWQPVLPAGTWYQHIFSSIGNFFRRLLGNEAIAQAATPVKWCADSVAGAVELVTSDGQSATSSPIINVRLTKPLAEDTYYAIVATANLRDGRGIRLGVTSTPAIFSTARGICEINAVNVQPPNWYFSRANATKLFTAQGVTAQNAPIQSIPGVYSWNYLWQPFTNDFVTLQVTTSSRNLVIANNRNGELDLRASAVVNVNTITNVTNTIKTGRSHIIVALCENPWPPKDLAIGSSSYAIFPFEDRPGNNDGYDLLQRSFNNTTIPPAQGGSAVGDGYFNFSTYYCADNGSASKFDDLPYLQVSVQTTSTQLRSDKGVCELNGNTCGTDADCGYYYRGTPSFFASSTIGDIKVCGGTVSTTAARRDFFDSDNEPIFCNAVTDCVRNDYVQWMNTNGLYANCSTVPTTNRRSLKCIRYPALKRFIFTDEKGSSDDAIGIQIFANPQHLTADQWYHNKRAAGGQGFVGNLQPLQVAGYSAIGDGSNYYVDALNYSSSTQTINSLIYLFSINSTAKAETRQVFDQILKNLKFNTNLPNNDGWCGSRFDQPLFEQRCSNDLECRSGQVCVNQVEKLKRDYQRLHDVQTVDAALDSYAAKNSGKYPAVLSGSYLPGQSLSVWTSWSSALGSSIGQVLPIDPINRLGIAGSCGASSTVKYCTKDSDCSVGQCTLHNQLTGWTDFDRRFSFACATSSYAYRYKFSTSTGYTFYTHFEDVGVTFSNLNDFIDGFNLNHPERFQGLIGQSGTSQGICEFDHELVSISSGFCGDGQVNLSKGEECDPPNRVDYNQNACAANPNGTVKVRKCSTACKWENLPDQNCTDVNKNCGNFRIDPGEQCDDGKVANGGQNGRWNKCSETCTFPPGTPSTTPVGPGFCGDRIIEPAFEVCDAGHIKVDRRDIVTFTTSSVAVKFCKTINGFTPTECSSAGDCAQYGTYQLFPSGAPTPFSTSEVEVTETTDPYTYQGLQVNRMSNIQVLSSSCQAGTSPYNCEVRFSYRQDSIQAYGHVWYRIDESLCTATGCPGTPFNLGGNGDNYKLTPDRIKIRITRNLSLPNLTCQVNDTCTPNPTQNFCKVNGDFTTTPCGQPLECNSYLSDFQRAVRSNYQIAKAVFKYNEISIQPIEYRIFNPSVGILYPSLPAGEQEPTFCDTTVRPFNCQVRFSFDDRSGTSWAAQAKFTLDPGACTINSCPTTITELTKAYPLAPNLPAYATIGSISVVVNPNGYEVNCERNGEQTCTLQTTYRTVYDYTTTTVFTTTTVDVNEPTYGANRAASCAWDCQKYGPYCGDGIVQAQYGEECDGDGKGNGDKRELTCSLSGLAGKQTCNTSCRFTDTAAVSWWKLSKSIGNTGSSPDDNGTMPAQCSGTACPATGDKTPQGVDSYGFNGTTNYLTIPHTAQLMPTSLSVEAWFKGGTYNTQYQRVLEKGGFMVGGGYSLEFNHDAGFGGHRLAFNVWGPNNAAQQRMTVFSQANIPVGEWRHVIATYEWKSGVASMKLYINGNLDTASSVNATQSIMSASSDPLYIGRASRGSNFFDGSISGVKIYDHVLQAAEVKDRYDNRWPCAVPAQSSGTLLAAAGTCGDGRVDAPKEGCDEGTRNGDASKCNNAYGQRCFYCSATCVPVAVEPKQFCGDGVLQGREVCETDKTTGKIYSQTTTTITTYNNFFRPEQNGYEVRMCSAEVAANDNSFKKGTKYCNADCSAILIKENNESSCVVCGIIPTGVTVEGNILNILDKDSGNPLYAFSDSQDTGGIVSLTAGRASTSTFIAGLNMKSYNSNQDWVTPTYTLYVNPGIPLRGTPPSDQARLNPSFVCSDGSSKSYTLWMNGTIIKNLNISLNPTSWQYDVALSPIISTNGLWRDRQIIPNSTRPNDVRIVVSWVDNNNFVGGYVKPVSGLSPTVEGGSLGAPTIGFDYFNKPYNDLGLRTTWYHGVSTTMGLLSAESFTIDTSNLQGDYMFYVRTPLNSGIRNFRNTAKLRVDVYLPETRAAAPGPQILGTPYRTFEFEKLDNSAFGDQAAKYWHVFTLSPYGATLADKIQEAAFYDPLQAEDPVTHGITKYPNGRTVTTPAKFYH